MGSRTSPTDDGRWQLRTLKTSVLRTGARDWLRVLENVSFRKREIWSRVLTSDSENESEPKFWAQSFLKGKFPIKFSRSVRVPSVQCKGPTNETVDYKRIEDKWVSSNCKVTKRKKSKDGQVEHTGSLSKEILTKSRDERKTSSKVLPYTILTYVMSTCHTSIGPHRRCPRTRSLCRRGPLSPKDRDGTTLSYTRGDVGEENRRHPYFVESYLRSNFSVIFHCTE